MISIRRALGIGLVSLSLATLVNAAFQDEIEARPRKPHAARTHKTTQTYPAQAPKHHLKNNASKDSLTVYYLTNSWALYENDKRDINTFFRQHANASRLIVEGYCDERGTLEDNIKLGEDRAKGVRNLLVGLGYRNPIDVTSFGEAKPVDPGHSKDAYKLNRRVTILAGEDTVISRALTLSPADVYLVDATGSMLGEKWDAVTGFKYPSKSTRYAFNTCIGAQNISSTRGVNPDCETQLWDATYGLLDSTAVKTGQRLTILTDGDDNRSVAYDPDLIIRLAKRKRVKISTIGIGVVPETKANLAKIAAETGGNFYIIN